MNLLFYDVVYLLNCYLGQDGYVLTGFTCVCYQDHTKTTRPIFTKFGGKVAHCPQEKPVDFGANPDHVMDLGYV